MFKLERRVNCWAHVIRKVDENLKPLNENLRDEIRGYIVKIQVCFNEAIFDKAIELFEKKWKAKKSRKVNDFLKYFKTQWCSEGNSGWFEGYASGMPSHSNGLESIHEKIKSDCKGKRFGLIDYLELLKTKTIYNMSRNRAQTWEIIY